MKSLHSPASRSMMSLTFWLVVYVVIINFNRFYFRGLWSFLQPQVPWNYIFALLPCLPIVGTIWGMLQQIEASDEYQRPLLTRRFMIATGLSLLVFMGYAFYENYLGTHTITPFYLFEVFCAFYLLAAPFTLAVDERRNNPN